MAKERRGELAKKSSYCFPNIEERKGGKKSIYMCSLFFGRQQLLPYNTKQVVIVVVVVVEASEICQSSFDQEHRA